MFCICIESVVSIVFGTVPAFGGTVLVIVGLLEHFGCGHTLQSCLRPCCWVMCYVFFILVLLYVW